MCIYLNNDNSNERKATKKDREAFIIKPIKGTVV